jgi:hypothetical protein
MVVWSLALQLYSNLAALLTRRQGPSASEIFDYEAESLDEKPEHKELVATLSKQPHSSWRPQLP